MLATDFSSFIEYTFGVLRPGILFHRNWHIDAMAYKLSQVATGEIKRLIITIPPRNLKSICASVALPAWFLGHHPSERVVAVSYSADLAKVHANDFRRVVNDPLYQAVFRLRNDYYERFRAEVAQTVRQCKEELDEETRYLMVLVPAALAAQSGEA